MVACDVNGLKWHRVIGHQLMLPVGLLSVQQMPGTYSRTFNFIMVPKSAFNASGSFIIYLALLLMDKVNHCCLLCFLEADTYAGLGSTAWC